MRAILSLVLILAAVSCSGDARSSGASGDSIAVVASFYPLAHLAEQIGGGDVAVTNLTPPGVEPHDLELTPADLEAIADADVVIIARGGFQPAVEEAVDAAATGIVLDALEGVDLLPPTEGGDGDGLDGDPHVWLDPAIYADIGDRVAATGVMPLDVCAEDGSGYSGARGMLGVRRPGGFAELVTVPAVAAVTVPEPLGFHDAAVIMRHAPTAWKLLFDCAALKCQFSAAVSIGPSSERPHTVAGSSHGTQ